MVSTEKYDFVKQEFLSTKQLNNCYQIVKDNMIKLGYLVNEQDKKTWTDNIRTIIKNNNNDFVIIYNNKKICGFIIIEKNNQIFVNEIQFDNQVKKTRLILQVIVYLYNQFSSIKCDEVFFNINNKNVISKKTFLHLGGEILMSNDKSSKYVIKKQDVEKYLHSLKIKL